MTAVQERTSSVTAWCEQSQLRLGNPTQKSATPSIIWPTKSFDGSDASAGVKRQLYKDYLKSFGWTWTATMGIGTGCTVHLADGELPMGTLIVSVSRHLVAVIDGVIQDTHDCSRGGTRCVYGYWRKA